MRKTLTAILGAALFALTFAPTAAFAEPVAGPHCAVQLTAAGPVQHCFPTFRQAIAFGTNGAVADAPDEHAAATDPAFAAKVQSPVARQVFTLIGVEYDAANYTGNTFSVFRAAACTGPTTDVDKQVSDLDVIGWNDKVSSFATYNNCLADHFFLADFQSVHTGYLSSRATMPIVNGTNMNDNARSIRWS
ncbi:hypothetical protein Lfu02_06310 [Longispora fulva]|uniref:Secreted protein n=1 Tax=Longispora fulva TaxID=619741 RepID=A0A8J7KJI3_9ACTN|nr:hypothetical protein [Longispora fulva]MBG6135501.1 hypothetical protein [Longispora fulva]GIG56259.1 hypothetical protein Lfu02_06310 [Longispora fulva]